MLHIFHGDHISLWSNMFFVDQYTWFTCFTATTFIFPHLSCFAPFGNTGIGHLLEGSNRIFREAQVTHRCSPHADAQDGEFLLTWSFSSSVNPSTSAIFITVVVLRLQMRSQPRVDIWPISRHVDFAEFIVFSASILWLLSLIFG